MLTQQIPSYPYQQYASDANISAFFTAYNQLSQSNLNTINAVQLPIYFDQSDNLLDWCAAGIYGLYRSSLPVGGFIDQGPLNTFEPNTEQPNEGVQVANNASYVVSDLVFQRIIQWNTFKGDGYQFNIRWLKRRVQRFLNGTIFPDQTYQVSVTFTGENSVLISLLPPSASAPESGEYNSAIYDVAQYNQNPVGSGSTSHTTYTSLTLAPYLQAGIQSGALQLPFQYTYTVQYS